MTLDDSGVRIFVPAGHYCSPVVDPGELRKSTFEARRANDKELGISIDLDAMEIFFRELMSLSPALPLPDAQVPSQRYHLQNTMYGIGDAAILSRIIHYLNPARIIEVGSGFSSAVILDTLDMLRLDSHCTFIEPYTARLNSILRHEDGQRVNIIESNVQDVDLDVFAKLGHNDILFLDTTHISKTGSDVNFEIFEVLPRLSPGVIVHFHDIFDKFEYPNQWIYQENRSWNEIYVLRAFLMYNREFDVIYANDAFAKSRRTVVQELCPELLRNAGGGLWLRKR